MAVNRIYGFIDLVGGGAGSLNKYPEAGASPLLTDDMAFGIVAGIPFEYSFDADSTEAENVPYVIAPSDNNGRWILRMASNNNESLSENSDSFVPTQKAVKAYVDEAVTTGTSGTSGTSGEKGDDGTSGTSGDTGSSGTGGTSGSSGTSGEDGTSGTSGVDGDDGTSGTSGTDGSSGTTNAIAGMIFDQITPTDPWYVNHLLDQKWVQVHVFGTSGKEISPLEIEPIDDNNLTITFGESVAGKAVITSGNAGNNNGIFTYSRGTTFVNHQSQGPRIVIKAGAEISEGHLLYCKRHQTGLTETDWLYYRYDPTGTDKLIMPSVIALSDLHADEIGYGLCNGGIMCLADWSFELAVGVDEPVTVYASDSFAGRLTVTPPSGAGDQIIVVGQLIGEYTVQLNIGYGWAEV